MTAESDMCIECGGEGIIRCPYCQELFCEICAGPEQHDCPAG